MYIHKYFHKVGIALVHPVEGVPAGFILKSFVAWGSSRWNVLRLKIYSGDSGNLAELHDGRYASSCGQTTGHHHHLELIGQKRMS